MGYALNAISQGHAVPWHRVINVQGRISMRGDGAGGSVLQRLRLEQEGVGFDGRGRVALDACRWQPRGWTPPERRRRGDVA